MLFVPPLQNILCVCQRRGIYCVTVSSNPFQCDDDIFLHSTDSQRKGKGNEALLLSQFRTEFKIETEACLVTKIFIVLGYFLARKMGMKRINFLVCSTTSKWPALMVTGVQKDCNIQEVII
jgi:hypothetical protein